MQDSPEVAAARIEVERARARLFDCFRAFEALLLDLRQQLTPRHIMSQIVDGAKNKGADLAEGAVDAIKARPLAATGVIAALTMFLARKPMMDFAGQLADSGTNKKKNQKRRKAPSSRKHTEAVE